MADPVYAVEAEFVTGSFTDVTSDCLRMTWNRELSTHERSFATGIAQFVMQNEQKGWTPSNSAGPYYPNLKPNRAIRIKATHSSSTYNLFTGRIDSIKVDPAFGNRTAYIRASDRIGILKNRDIDQGFNLNYNVGSLVTDVLSALGVSSADRTIDTLTDTLTFAWFADRAGVGVIDDIIEFGNYKGYVDGGGKINVKNRNFNIEGVAVGSLNEFMSLDHTLDKESVFNVIRVVGESPRKAATSVGTIAWLTETLSVPASGHASFWLDYVDPVTLEQRTPANSVAFPVSSTDYLMNTQSDGGGSDLTATMSVNGALFGTTCVFSLFNGDGNVAYITKFQVRGFSIQAQPNTAFQIEVNSSITDYDRREFTLTSPLIDNMAYAEDYATFLSNQKKDPSDVFFTSVKNVWPDTLGWELGNLLHLTESQTQVASVMNILGMEHSVELERGLEHTVGLELEGWRDWEWLILDDPVYGLLDSRRLGF